MKAIVNSIDGIADAICTMYISKHNLTRELETYIRSVVEEVTDRTGLIHRSCSQEAYEEFQKWLDMLCKMGRRHITVLKFIDISVSVYGMHRAGQDDIDSHACRFHNRIIRNSSRFAGIKDESHLQNMSEYYSDKVLTTDAAINELGIELPEKIDHDGKTYVRAFNGYIVEGMENNQDVKRGLYNLGYPSDFLFRVNLAEFAHVYQERGNHGGANPEVKQCIEMIVDQLEQAHNQFNRELLMNIKN